MIPAAEPDRPWIEARLRDRLATSMFPLANLAEFGWDGDAPRAMRFWIDRPTGNVFGSTNEGMLMPQMPGGDFGALREILAGRPAMGAAGDAAQVRPMLRALGLDGVPEKLDEDEPQFLLDLAALDVPPGEGTLLPIGDADPDLMKAWRAAYGREVLGEDADGSRKLADTDIPHYAARDSHRVLVINGAPVALTGWNARLPDIVQIGGVYTPPALRGRGHARRAVALHLAELARAGAMQATLFASGRDAVRAYEALGFRRIGSYSLVLFRHPVEIAA